MKPISVVQDTKYPEMYRLKWKDGVLSEDFYNLTRAKDILRNYDSYRDNMKKVSRMKITRARHLAEKAASAL